MEPSLAPVLGAVLPVFGLVACGVLAQRYKLLEAEPSTGAVLSTALLGKSGF
jgi:hypothetical protein